MVNRFYGIEAMEGVELEEVEEDVMVKDEYIEEEDE
jgi:hypothetical protein